MKFTRRCNPAGPCQHPAPWLRELFVPAAAAMPQTSQSRFLPIPQTEGACSAWAEMCTAAQQTALESSVTQVCMSLSGTRLNLSWCRQPFGNDCTPFEDSSLLSQDSSVCSCREAVGQIVICIRHEVAERIDRKCYFSFAVAFAR